MAISLYTAEQSRQIDRKALQMYKIPGYELMTRAAQASYSCLLKKWPKAKSLTVVCGVGNNAGDGFVLANLAFQDQKDVQVIFLGQKEQLKGDALQAYEDLIKSGFDSFTKTKDFQDRDVIVDAIFGTGLYRDVDGDFKEIISLINASETPVLAIDVPSGLNADTGSVMGQAVRADATVSFIVRKQGLYTADGPDYCGAIYFHDLKVPQEAYQEIEPNAQLLDFSEEISHLQKRKKNSNKGSFGKALILGGDIGMMGAVRLAGEAALRVGAGLVTICTHRDQSFQENPDRPELIIHADNQIDSLLQNATTVAVGPGLGQSAWSKAIYSKVIQTNLNLVVDADALNLLAKDPIQNKNWILAH